MIGVGIVPGTCSTDKRRESEQSNSLRHPPSINHFFVDRYDLFLAEYQLVQLNPLLDIFCKFLPYHEIIVLNIRLRLISNYFLVIFLL